MALKNKNKLKDLPNNIPLFPLTGIVMFPNTYLPLKIFESRYINMLNKALSSDHKLIGMIQPNSLIQKDNEILFYKIGCAGKIINFEEIEDNSFLITLKGLSRFDLISEKNTKDEFKVAEVDWKNFYEDIKLKEEKIYNGNLKELLKKYFYLKKIKANMDTIDACNDFNLVDQLTMICPLSSEDKQLLLETQSLAKRNQLFVSMLEILIKELDNSDVIKH